MMSDMLVSCNNSAGRYIYSFHLSNKISLNFLYGRRAISRLIVYQFKGAIDKSVKKAIASF